MTPYFQSRFASLSLRDPSSESSANQRQLYTLYDHGASIVKSRGSTEGDVETDIPRFSLIRTSEEKSTKKAKMKKHDAFSHFLNWFRVQKRSITHSLDACQFGASSKANPSWTHSQKNDRVWAGMKGRRSIRNWSRKNMVKFIWQ